MNSSVFNANSEDKQLLNKLNTEITNLFNDLNTLIDTTFKILEDSTKDIPDLVRTNPNINRI